MAEQFDNFKNAMKDGKARTIFIGGLAITAAIIVFAVLSFSAKKNSSVTYQGGASEVQKLPSVQQSPESLEKRATPAYDKLIKDENDRTAEDAKRSGGSAVPVLRSGVDQSPAASPQAVPAVPAMPTQPTSTDGRNDQEQKRQQAIIARAQAMKNQVNLLVAAWAPKEHVALPLLKDAAGRADATTIQGVQAAGQTQSAALSTRPPIKKAGDSCYAMLDTAVNTDEPSPVTATILQCGDLDQAKVIGKIEVAQNAQKTVLRFTTINIPGQTTSLPMDGVAIDEATRRTALASDVDNHYLLRYGSLFASAFLSGFGDALLKGGQDEQIVTTTTGAVIQRKAYDTKQLVLAGVGNVGKQVGVNMGSVFTRSPTITINAGIGIGILFTSDLTLK